MPQSGQRWGDRPSYRMALLLLMGLGLWGGSVSPALAQRNPAAPNPLEVDETDPLLPDLVVDRPLSPQERRVLTAAIEELRLQAETRFNEGDVPGAFDIWIRELRLRRVLGTEEEVAALSRVGEVAWKETQTTEVRLITERLFEIEQEVQAQTPPDYDLLLQIAQAYQKLRDRNRAVALYDQILIQAQQTGDQATQDQTLRALGEMHLIWFDYPQAAAAYRQLLERVRSQGDRITEIDVLERLAFIYDGGNEPAEAIAVRNDLIVLYREVPDLRPIPALKIAIADDYLELGRPDLAAPNYQEAFAVARTVQFYGYAADALRKLAELYISLERQDDALVVYQLLLDVEVQSYNYYGMMNAYDWIGQIHRNRGATTQAANAFQQGLDLAQQLNYRIDYFTQQLQALGQ
ncbi:MAG: tetratricopeptide repeat protein [Synechococcales bacterium]|nr:tetratricopeptide repeat protein [Synechococcales bacterium]